MPITGVPATAVDPVAQVVATLEAATAALAGASLTLADRGSWVTSTAYAVGDVVTQAGLRYCCRTAHTSGTFATDLAASKWVSLDAVAALAASSNLSDVVSPSSARTNLGLGASAVMSTAQIAADSALTGVFGRKVWFDVRDYGAVLDGATDDTAAFNAAVTAAGVRGGTVFIPATGIMQITGTTSAVPGTVTLRGVGRNYGITSTGASEQYMTRGSVIRAGASMTRLIQLGSAQSSFDTESAASMCDLALEGKGFPTYVVQTAGRRNYIERCSIHAGTSSALYVNGQNNYIQDSQIGNGGVGDAIFVNGQNDSKFFRNQIRDSGSTGACLHIKANGKMQIADNHMWQNSNYNSGGGNLIWIEATAGNNVNGFVVSGNTLEATISHKIRLTSVSTGNVSQVTIVGNDDYQPLTVTDQAQSFVYMEGAGNVTDVIVSANMLVANGNSNRYKAIVESAASGTVSRINVSNNIAAGTANITTGISAFPIVTLGNQLFNGAASVRDILSGRSTQSGTGAQTAFTIAHSMGVAPTSVSVTPGSTDAKGDFYATADATNITVTYGTAPASGTNNVVLNWTARL